MLTLTHTSFIRPPNCQAMITSNGAAVHWEKRLERRAFVEDDKKKKCRQNIRIH